MIRIVGKGYKYLLKQLNDFLEISEIIVISLKSVDGRNRYEKLFGRKLEDKKVSSSNLRVVPCYVIGVLNCLNVRRSLNVHFVSIIPACLAGVFLY